jgi:hypothetical protein
VGDSVAQVHEGGRQPVGEHQAVPSTSSDRPPPRSIGAGARHRLVFLVVRLRHPDSGKTLGRGDVGDRRPVGLTPAGAGCEVAGR